MIGGYNWKDDVRKLASSSVAFREDAIIAVVDELLEKVIASVNTEPESLTLEVGGSGETYERALLLIGKNRYKNELKIQFMEMRKELIGEHGVG